MAASFPIPRAACSLRLPPFMHSGLENATITSNDENRLIERRPMCTQYEPAFGSDTYAYGSVLFKSGRFLIDGFGDRSE